MSTATMEVLQVLKYSIREKHREQEQKRGFVHGPDHPGVLTARGHGAEVPPAVPLEAGFDGDGFSPGRMRNILEAMREDSRDENVT